MQLKKNFFTSDGKGIRRFRILGISIIDVLGTILLALLSQRFLSISFEYALIFWFVIGELAHKLFGVQTALLSMLNM